MGAPLELADVLKMEAEEAQQVYASVIAERRKQRELEEESVIAADAEDQTSKPAVLHCIDSAQLQREVVMSRYSAVPNFDFGKALNSICLLLEFQKFNCH